MTVFIWLSGIAATLALFVHVHRETQRNLRKPIFGPRRP